MNKSFKAFLVGTICFITTAPVPADVGWYGDIISQVNILIENYRSNKIDGTFEDLYPKPFLQTTTGMVILIGGSAILVGAITYATAGGGVGSAGPIASYVGTQVGMATGVGSGATAAGLATLGGGTIASGGLGIAGGISFLSAIADIGMMMAMHGVTLSMPSEAMAVFTRYQLLKVPIPQKANEKVLKILQYAEELTNDMMKASVEDQSELAKKIQQQYQKALEELQSIDPKSEYAGYDYIVRAVIEYNFMEYDKALASIKVASEYVNNEAFTGYMVALIKLTQNNKDSLDAAAAELDKVTELDPQAIQPYILQTMVHIDKEQPEIALERALKGLDNVDDNFELNWRTAGIAFHLEKYEKSIDLYKEALSNITLDELEAHCKMMIAVSLYRQKKKDDALDWYHDAIDEISGIPDEVKKMSELWFGLTKENRDA